MVWKMEVVMSPMAAFWVFFTAMLFVFGVYVFQKR